MVLAQEAALKEVGEMKLANRNREIEYPPSSSDEDGSENN